MKKYIFLTLTICLSIGIIVSDLLNSATNLRIIFLVIICLLLACLIKSSFRQNIYSFLITSIILGFYLHQHYNFKEKKEINTSSEVHLLKIISKASSSIKFTNYIAEDIETSQQIFLHLKDKTQLYFPEDILIVDGKIKDIQPALNPYQFNYKQFLRRKNIHSQLFSDKVITIHKKGNGFYNWASKSKLLVREKLKENGYSTESRAIISSMLLGNKTELSEELNQNYITTGVVHILAISGLHVMMIFILIQFLLKPILYLKNGRKIRIITSLIVIWFFAFYVELKTPVFRSALMISIYYISDIINRPKNIFHTLSLAAFIILVFQPNALFDVGFQLSFSAVFFIVWLHPIFDNFWKIKNNLLHQIKGIITTSISTQIGTLPVSIFYFNQFSGLFLFGNLILIPASFIMICGGLISIFLIVFNIKIDAFTWLYNQFVHLINSYIHWLAEFSFIAKDIYISFFTAFLITVILFCLKSLILNKSKVALFITIGCFTLIELDRLYEVIQLNSSNELIVYNQYKNSIINIRNGRSLAVFSSHKIDDKTYQYILKPYKVKHRIKQIDYFSYTAKFKHSAFIKHENYIETKSFNFLLDKTKSDSPFYVLIHQSKLYPFQDNNNLKRVIADASNYPSIISELENNSNSSLWKTSEKGYFSIKF
ncbi:competence protein ComEC [Chishuiella changwenlii]|uniref:Competence protein ComEC n=1 Tax=Chishuiella changwenlii TaxID=1434701 RepID=A0A1M6ZUH8_9FLAO|nr:ComEC/Rec2 family competence protein [Chishuiella changwenlii]GGE92522.1 competence protein ComEC [Chishuiella changwenlii]SHL34059.1 competence protein ComEC [Chishuiella changwenlii]